MEFRAYLDFSIKYKLLNKKVNFPKEIKLIIWKFYLNFYASDIINNFIVKNLLCCRDCGFKSVKKNFYYYRSL